MKRYSGMVIVSTVLVLSLMTWGHGQDSAARPAGPAGPTRVAVVNLVKIFDGHDGCKQIKDLNTLLRETREDVAKEADTRRKSLEVERAKLTGYRPDSADYPAAKDAFVKMNINFNAWWQAKKEEIDGDEFKWMWRMYQIVTSVVTDIAKERQIDMVITTEPFEPAIPNDDTRPIVALQSHIRGRKVLYNTSDVDITEAVIKRLDAEYDKKGGRSSLPGTPASVPAGAPADASGKR